MIDTFSDALEMGAAYAMYRHGQDRQTEDLIAGLSGAGTPAPAAPAVPSEITVRIDDTDPQATAPVNVLDLSSVPDLGWDNYIGQEPLKQRLQVAIASAKAQGKALPHILLASGNPGVGKTKAALNVAKSMGCSMIQLVPPFSIETLAEAAESLLDGDILFIDEIHKLKDRRRGDEILLKLLEEHTLYMPNGDVLPVNNITVIGATTDPDLLGEPVLDRFKIKPYFQPYNLGELAQIAITFADKHNALQWVDADMAVDIAGACRNTPRIIEEMVMAVNELGFALNRQPTADELFAFMEVEPDGLTRKHIQYLELLFSMPRPRGRGEERKVEFVAGEYTLISNLRETKQGVARLERYLLQLKLIDRPAYGRRLTDAGIARIQQCIREGKAA